MAKYICPISLDEVDVLETTTLKCGHMFTFSKITEWMKKSKTCPLCRAPIEPEIYLANTEFDMILNNAIMSNISLMDSMPIDSLSNPKLPLVP